MQLRPCIRPFGAMLMAACMSCQAHVYSLHVFSDGTVHEYDGFIGPPSLGLRVSVNSYYEDSRGLKIIDVGREVERGGVLHRYADIHFGACSLHVRMPTEDEVRAHSPFQVRLIET